MDEEKLSLPYWLPWATTACLAALVACLGELWIIEKAKARLKDDELLMGQASLRASQNELAAERIVSRREIGDLVSATAGAPAGPAQAWGVPAGAWILTKDGDAANLADKALPWAVGGMQGSRRQAVVVCFGLPMLPAGRSYQVWFDGPPPLPSASMSLHGAVPGNVRIFQVALPQPCPAITRVLVLEQPGRVLGSVDEALAAGSIVLATPSPLPSISGR